jgi:hypothetical protein
MKKTSLWCAALAGAGMMAAVQIAGLQSATAQAKPTIETGLEHFQGRWVWQGALKDKRDPKNISRLQFTDGDRIVYCYKTLCVEVNVHRDAGGGFSFTTNGKNNFVMVSDASGTLRGRFWEDFTSPSRPPDAVVTFTLKSGI